MKGKWVTRTIISDVKTKTVSYTSPIETIATVELPKQFHAAMEAERATMFNRLSNANKSNKAVVVRQSIDGAVVTVTVKQTVSKTEYIFCFDWDTV